MQANLANTPTAGEHVVLNQAAANPLRLVTANGIHVGDVIEVQVPGSPHQHARVDAIAVEGDGTALTLSPAIAATAGTVAPRTARFKAKLTAPNAAPTFDQLTWAETEPPGADSLLVDGFRAFLEDGRVAAWSTDHWELPGNDPIPPAKLEIEAQVSMRRFFEDVTLDHPTVADLNRRYGFFPDGTTLRLRPTAGALVDIPKVGDSFDDSGLAPGDLDRVFNRARFGPTNTGAGVLARAGRAPELGDRAAYGTVQTVTGVEALGGDVFFVTMTGATAVHDNDTPVVLSRFQNSRIVPLRFKVRVAGKGGVAEEYPNLALAGSHPRSYDRDGIVNGVSALIRVKSRLNPSPITEALLPARLVATAPGTSRPATANGMKRGFDTLELEPEPAMVICPDALTLDDPLAQADVIGWMVARCEEFRRFAIVDPPNETDDEELVQWRLDNVNSTNAAVYAPHVKILNLDPAAAERFRTVPPSGFVAGVFARTDRERGVHKAPANERMNGIFGLAVDYSQRRQDLLNPSGVNLIRKFPGRGRRIWGARNATDDTTWRYVNVRRLFNFVESSVERGTQWVVFEPNTANTWLRVRVTVENFLNQLWRAGALAGTSPEEAYRVRVGLGETMNESDIQLGLIVTEVAIAPAYPAEFVVFRFSHKRLSE
jgi:hypothetical protein